MPNMFNSLAEVEAYVRQDPAGNAKGTLRVQLATGSDLVGHSRAVVEAWLAQDDVRAAREDLARRESADRALRVREVHAVEAQAKSSRDATLIAWIALGFSAFSVVVAIFAFVK